MILPNMLPHHNTENPPMGGFSIKTFSIFLISNLLYIILRINKLHTLS